MALIFVELSPSPLWTSMATFGDCEYPSLCPRFVRKNFAALNLVSSSTDYSMRSTMVSSALATISLRISLHAFPRLESAWHRT